MPALLERPVLPEVDRSIHQRANPTWKRVLDLMVFAILVPILTPLLLLVAVYIKLVSPGPAFFLQTRVGHGGNPFTIFKFRTMHVASVSRDLEHRNYVAAHAVTGTPVKKPENRSQLIPGGSLIRKLSIDELPQLWNVAQGNMSLVGPRPDLLLLEDYEAWQLARFEVLPGMTGLWQISGKNRLTFEEMVRLDIQYARSLSLQHDLRIILMTVLVIIKERNE
ncbi:Sugar transferase involved in LPS biosynthesis (colanic, teichoic acid) [Neorhodopirellula lusitana]|uniref:Sugar transferase involved in LPS biosynthesis (Colanic, teichoic acid) n=1 Tax=Neorhodopirellula lusitana TaxID=445327 RepID=A0ABY1QDT5_9BACT|nr:sugar transferase [Neorhodopirellula lusitana]SMP68578.1 Sugar transferase involved in LPS biosynthesis (colanic, teichoic acid) [Neorhodopirellula lusitana]